MWTSVIQETLRELGVTRNYRGYNSMVLAIERVLENEDCLDAVTKEIYIEIAQRSHCKWTAIERNMRTIVQRAWQLSSARLCAMAGYQLPATPTTSEFIEIVSSHIQRRSAAVTGRTP